MFSPWLAVFLWPFLASVKEVVGHSWQSTPTDVKGSVVEGIQTWALQLKASLYCQCAIGHVA